MRREVVLYSGGLDSFITLHNIRSLFPSSEIIPVYIPLGHKYQSSEIRSINATGENVFRLIGIQRLGQLEESNANIWHRNAFLCLMASKLFHENGEPNKNGTIWLTVQKDELSIPDRTPAFMRSMGETLKTLGLDVTVESPFLNLDKTGMVKWYVDAGLDIEQLKKTHSCYRPGCLPPSFKRLPCGNCPACIRRYIAMSLNGIDEEYIMDPLTSDVGKEYLKRACEGYYSEERNTQTMSVLG